MRQLRSINGRLFVLAIAVIALLSLSVNASAYSIAGTVRDLATSSPIAGATVTVKVATSSTVVGTMITNASGNYTVSIPTVGTYTVQASKPGYDDISSLDPIDLQLTPDATKDMYLFQIPAYLALSSGWNFISFSTLPSTPGIATVLANVLSDVRIVWGWDNANQVWNVFVPGGQDNSLLAFEFGKGYWIYMNAPGTINIVGWAGPVSRTVSLSQGWNLIGYMGSDNIALSTAMAPLSGKWSMVWGWQNNVWYGKHEIVANLPGSIQPLTTFRLGNAYWIKIKQGMGTQWTQQADSGEVSGSVKNGADNSALAGVTVTAYDGQNLLATTATDTSGTYSLVVRPGSPYSIVFTKAGFVDANYQAVRVQPGVTTHLEPVLMSVAQAGPGSVSGTIRSALTGNGVSGLTIDLRSGINITSGTIIQTVQTQTDGTYSFTGLQAGNYTGSISGTGYNATSFTIISVGGVTTGNQDATITPVLTSGETRIVLTWGETPTDLDSHLTGPLSDGSRFHMWFSYTGNSSPWPDYVKLDLDDVTSFGPETTTVYQQLEGTYRFSVYNYSDGGSSNSMILSDSGAQVKVYRGSDLVATFNVPVGTGGTLWTVFEMQGQTITPINTISYHMTGSSNIP
jgi:hypothetical protein